jgi:hypothetical protein
MLRPLCTTVASLVRSTNVLGAQREQGEIKPGDDESSVNLIPAQAFVALAQNKKDELLQRGFDLANRVILHQQGRNGSPFVVGLGPLAQIGMQNDPHLTTTFIEALPSSYVKGRASTGSSFGTGSEIAAAAKVRISRSGQTAQRCALESLEFTAAPLPPYPRHCKQCKPAHLS